MMVLEGFHKGFNTAPGDTVMDKPQQLGQLCFSALFRSMVLAQCNPVHDGNSTPG